MANDVWDADAAADIARRFFGLYKGLSGNARREDANTFLAKKII